MVPVVVLLTLSAPAAAEHGDIHPTTRSQRTYFNCAGPVKAQNVAYAQGTVPGWDTTAPTTSVTAGGGCGYFENAVGGWLGNTETTLDSIWEGTFTGNVDSITVELHSIYAAAARVSGPYILRASLFIDGVDVINPDNPQISVAPVPSSTRLSEKLSFTLSGIDLLTEDGDGTTQRTFRLIIRSVGEEQSAWVWDTTEVPAGLTFNPDTPESLVVDVR